MSIVQSVRDGKDYDSRFFERMKPRGVWADVFRTRFRIGCRRLGLNREPPQLDCSQFTAPSAGGQLRLL